MDKDKVINQIEALDDKTLCEMMESKVTMAFSISQLMDISSALATYLDSPMGLMVEITSAGSTSKVKERIDDRIKKRLGTYGIFVDDMEEE